MENLKLALPEPAEPSLPAMVDRAARALAQAGNYAQALVARELAKRAYDDARRVARLGELREAFDGIAATVAKAQADALEIEIEATALLALRYDEAQKKGEVAKATDKLRHGSVVPAGNNGKATTADLGLDRKLIHEGRRINKAKAIRPDIIRSTLDGLAEPTRTQLRGAITKIVSKPPAETGTARECFTVEEWNETFHHPDLTLTLRSNPAEFGGEKAKFLKQTSSGIEWAQWSWNPVTGCLHECPYCYARDIAERYGNAFPRGFEPVLWTSRIAAPDNTNVPKEAETDTRYRNVFTCSMADLFGRWVPAEWIELVLHQVRENPQWNFLFLTKFPKRMAEFDIPPNAWMGTTVDLQARVKSAEDAFARVKSGIRWLSVEPMLEPLKFTRLELFDWIVIGGASPSKQTPAWRPPIDWIIELRAQARAAGLAIYDKTNLYGNRTLELPFNAPIEGDPTEAPAVFHYLGGKKS